MKKFLIIIIFISCLFTLSLNHIYAIVPPPYKIVLYEYDKPLTEKSAVLISGNPYGAARTWGLCEKGICYIDAGSNYVIHFYIFSKSINLAFFVSVSKMANVAL